MAKLEIYNIGEANSKIDSLRLEQAGLRAKLNMETETGSGEKFWNILAANDEIRRLKAENDGLRQRLPNQMAPSKPATPPVISESAKPLPIPVMHSLPQSVPTAPTPVKPDVLEIAATALGSDTVNGLSRQGLSRAQAEENCERRLFLSGFRWAGMDTARLTEKYGTQPKATGLQFAISAGIQQKIDAMAEPKTKAAAKSDFSHLKGIDRAIAAHKSTSKK